jgi:hypothetical protein
MQLVILQAILVVENLEVVFREDSEILVMMPLFFKSLGVAAVVLVAVPTVSHILVLQTTEVSVVLQVSLRASLHLLLILVVMVAHPVALRVVLPRLLTRLVLVAVAALKVSHLLIHLVDQVVPDLPVNPVHHPVVTQ